MVSIEIEDPKKALEILRRLDVVDFSNADYTTDTACYQWIEDMKYKIEAAMLKEAENAWKPMSSFNDRDGVFIEINEFGEIRVEETIFKPVFDDDVERYITTFVDQLGEEHPIDARHFVKVHFNKDYI